MRAELPWNVAGIPPEAREAARAAARREGLSVGEWLTRRILRSFSGMEEELAHMAYENRASTTLDGWGLTPSVTGRRDAEEVVVRAGRSENESNETWRRIEDQLRGLSRRLDSSERDSGESNPVLSRTAQEMNLAAHEQAEAFGQLGTTVAALNERLERLERSAAHDNIREAVKALHQGLSRLADQITATANTSAGKVEQLTSDLEQLAGRVGQTHLESEEADKALASRIGETATAMDQRLDAMDHALDARLSALDPRFSSLDERLSALDPRFSTLDVRLASVEKTAQFNTNALDHALEKIDASANQRATDQVENQKRAARHEDTIHRLEDSIARLEMRLPDAEFERRLDGIEHAVGGMASELKDFGPAERFDATLKAISSRLDAMEKDHDDLLTELRTRGPHTAEPPAPAPASSGPPPREEPQTQSAPPSFEPPPFAEQPAAHEAMAEATVAEQAMAEQTMVEPAMAEQAMAEQTTAEQTMAEPAMTEPEPFLNFGDEAAHAFAETDPHGFALSETDLHGFALGETESQDFAFDIPPDSPDLFAPPQFEDDFAEEAEPENFLAQARRSARAASEKAEAEGRGRLSAFRWGKNPSATGEEKAGSRYLLPSLVVVLVVAIAAAALILNQRARHSDVAAAAFTRPATAQRPPNPLHVQPASHVAQLAAAPQATSQGGETNFDTQRSQPGSQDNPPHAAVSQQDVRTAPVNPVPQAAKPVGAAATANAGIDKVIQYANAGNPVAQTILGLRDLDGTGGTSVNVAAAMKFLSQAAEKGQAVAQYRLGTMYERGQGVAADPAKAAHWYELSANQGNRKAMHNLAVSYASGANGKKDMAEGARWFAKAAALGLSDSQFNLAVLYERGDGVPQSLLDAYKWYSIAAATGDSESRQRMSFLQTQLSDTDKAAANRSAAIFHAAPLNRAANVPPEAADLGR